MIEVRESAAFVRWLVGLRDSRARSRIVARIRRLALGNIGDTRPVGEGVGEMRIDYGPGYRVYFIWREPQVVLLLTGGDKQTQERDIAKALRMAREL